MKKQYKLRLIVLFVIIILICISFLIFIFIKKKDNGNINQPIEYYIKANNSRNPEWFEKCFKDDEYTYTLHGADGVVTKHYENIKYSTKKFKEFMDRNDERYGKDWELSYRILSCEWFEDLGYYEVSVELLFKGNLNYEVDEISFNIINDNSLIDFRLSL